jgi:hypothetical protein
VLLGLLVTPSRLLDEVSRRLLWRLRWWCWRDRWR